MGYKYDVIDSIKKARRARAPGWLVAHLLRQKRLFPVEIDGLRIFVRSTTPDMGIALSLPREFNSMFDLVPQLTHHLIIDAGGYIGTAAIAFARRYPDATVVTVEPSPENFAVLVENVKPFPNIKPLNKAIAATAGTQRLFDRGRGEWGLTLVEDAADYKTTSAGDVETVTIDQIISNEGAAGADILKIDIEGGEADLLSGNTRWIEKIEAICIELHDRIKPGCTKVWERVTAGRSNGNMGWEKQYSLRDRSQILMQ